MQLSDRFSRREIFCEIVHDLIAFNMPETEHKLGASRGIVIAPNGKRVVCFVGNASPAEDVFPVTNDLTISRSREREHAVTATSSISAAQAIPECFDPKNAGGFTI